MNNLNFFIIIVFSFIICTFFKRNLFNMCEIDKCPYCFGTDLCNEFEDNNITLVSNSFAEFFSNYFSVKNVFYGLYNDKMVVIKKLGHNSELNQLKLYSGDGNSVDKENLITLLTQSNNFKVCCPEIAEKFLNKISVDITNKLHLWTILQINAEPLIIQLLKAENNWPVPFYLGACGRFILENHCGNNLNFFVNADWHLRSNLALQLLEAAKNFTDRHEDFRFYLTDVSPDNIAVSNDLRIGFVDLENIILTDKHNTGLKHFSQRFSDDDFVFSESELCNSSISDHNYYAICKLLLSRRAPWPMMQGGLLHSPPDEIVLIHSNLFTLIESCAHDINCFVAVEEIILILKNLEMH